MHKWDEKGRDGKTLRVTEGALNCINPKSEGFIKTSDVEQGFWWLSPKSFWWKLILVKSCKQGKDKTIGDIKDKLFNNFR